MKRTYFCETFQHGQDRYRPPVTSNHEPVTINPITIQSNIEAAFRKKGKTTKKSRMPTCWGCVGTTGAFIFYHPITEPIIIGTFNDFSYRGKALGFMARKVIREVLKLEK